MAILVSVHCAAVPCTTSFVRAESIDRSLYRTIHEDWQSPFLDPVMKGASRLGSARGGLAVSVALMALGDEKAQETGKLAVISLAGASAVASALKFAVNRDRPDGSSHDRFNSSFPSGHATGAFAMASVAGARYGSLKVPVYLLASTVALSRVYLGRHYPSDVLAGVGIGLCAGWVVMKNEQRILGFHF